MPDKERLVDLTAALRTWAFREGITPKQFQQAMGYQYYSHAWTLVARNGKGHFSDKAWGRFIWAYGLSAFRELIKIANTEMEQGHAEVRGE